MSGSRNRRTCENCLRELLLNCLDSKAMAIAVRVNDREARITVVDNGCGISKNALSYLGEWENEPSRDGDTTRRAANFGKGLPHVRECSSFLVVTSRRRGCLDTYAKFFRKGRAPVIRKMEPRPSGGTTVSIYVSERSSRYSRALDVYQIRRIIFHLALINRRVSFSVCDDARQRIVLGIGKNQKITRLLRGTIENKSMVAPLRHGKISTADNVKIEIFWGADGTKMRENVKIFLNRRPVDCPLLRLDMLRIAEDGKFRNGLDVAASQIFFLLYIESPETEYTFAIRDDRRTVEFHEIDKMVESIGKFVAEAESPYETRLSSKLLNYRAVVPSLTFRAAGRVFGTKGKRSFLHRGTEIGEKKLGNFAARRREYVQFSSTDEDAAVWPVDTAVKSSSRKTEKGAENRVTARPNRRCVEKLDGGSSTSLPREMEHEREFSINADDYSQWSDWNYEPRVKNERNESTMTDKRFKFLPLELHALVPRRNVQLTTRDPTAEEIFTFQNTNSMNNRHRNVEVRACTGDRTEFTLKLQSLKDMKVLNQVNREFIVASTRQDDKELLVIIDQHAMHERIRYERLLKAYKGGADDPQQISVFLRRPLVISDFSSDARTALSTNRHLLTRYGLTLDRRSDDALLVRGVPRCFFKKTLKPDDPALENAVRKLLNEFVEDLAEGGFKKLIPLTIREAVATEACRGSIKFGDPLTAEQCDTLVSRWKETDVPNRCAHGRPSVVPLLELVAYRTRRRDVILE